MSPAEIKQFLRDFGSNKWIGAPVYDDHCARCPSHPDKEHDPEAKDFLAMPVEYRRMTVFPCAWRRKKLCKGWAEACEHGLLTQENAE